METRSQWEDTGYDCNFCGGQIFKRTDQEPTGLKSSYYQCELCGAQWSMTNQLIREGDRMPQRGTRPPAGRTEGRQVASWVWLVLGFGAMFLLMRASVVGALLVRFLIPVLFALVVSLVLFRLGREMEWW